MLPTIDLTAFRLDPTSADGRAVADQLRDACHSPGFCYVTGHGVEPAVDTALFEQMRLFFALDDSARRALAIERSAAFRGYTITGDERTNDRVDWRDQLDYGPEQVAPSDPTGVPAWHRLRGPNQWPPELPSLSPAALAWMDAVTGVGVTSIRALAVALGLAIDHFDAMFVPDSDVHVKLIRYPADSASGQGVGPHHDSGLLTFIAQDPDQVGRGLQVLVDGEFVDAPPLPGSYVMNLGEMLQRATGGYLQATPHRVMSPGDGAPERLSAALFFNPRFESVFEALPIEFTADAGADEPIDVAGEPILASFGENNLKVRLRSHPDVAARHYPDVHTA